MKAKKAENFKLVQFKWLFLTNAVVVIVSVMAFGLIALAAGILNADNAIYMIGMILPMTAATAFTTKIILSYVRAHMDKLLSAIHAVSEGNLDVALPTARSGEYKMIYEDFNRMVAQLRKSREETDTFVNAFTHEFKTPITCISGYAQLLAETGEGIETQERMQYLQIIADEARRLSELSQNTLLLSKVESCEIITDREHFDLGEQLRQVLILLLPQMEKKKIALDADFDDIPFYGNQELLEHVWLNLINNAIKFTPENGEIAVRAVREGDAVRVSIADNGIGMDAQTKAHIFEKYYQGAGSSGAGNGIGLTIAHRIAVLCGGTIDVESAPGEGSTFTVTLPVQDG